MPSKILLVEDNADSCDYLTRLLQIKGYQVQTAADGLAALEKIESFAPDVIISDMMMPRLDGIQFLQVLQKTIKYRHIPVIMVSAYGSGNLKDAVRTGADEVINKPFDFNRFFQTWSATCFLFDCRDSWSQPAPHFGVTSWDAK